MSSEKQMTVCSVVLVAAMCAVVRGVAMYSHGLAWIVGGLLVSVPAFCFGYQLVKEEKRRSR